MNNRMKLRAIVALVAVLLVAACSGESNQNQPVLMQLQQTSSGSWSGASVSIVVIVLRRTCAGAL